MKISDILRYKGSNVYTIDPARPVTELLALLSEHRVGAMIVAEGSTVAGIVSERDVVRRLNERGASVLDGPISDIMTSVVQACTSADSVDSVAERMTESRIRHMPVIDDGELRGIISIGDVVSIRIRQLEKEAGQLEQYITG
jgi:CBS domain-containing protein